jgi:alcohol dehydrogenase, propanol-preferring
MPLRPILKKDLTVRSSQTGTKQHMQEALQIFADKKVVPELEVVELRSINEALDRIHRGEVTGKLVADLRLGKR